MIDGIRSGETPRPFRWLCLIFGLSGCAAGATIFPLAPDGQTEHYQGIRLLGTLRLPPRTVDGLRFAGLSALAWDEDEQLLYAVSDLGRLFHIRPVFDGSRLASAELVAGHPLTDAEGRALRYPWSDAEGLTLRGADDGIAGNTELIVSFEHRPRVRVYDPRGRRLRAEPLPAFLENPRSYAHPNRALESVTLHPRWGLLVAPELPLRGSDAVPIFSQDGRRWAYPLSPAPGSALVALETLPDGSLLALERAFVAPYLPFSIHLRRVELPAEDNAVRVADVASFNTAAGWRLDNFEGLAHHRGQRFFMISDDNDSIWQSTLLVYFELLPHAP